MQETLGTLLSVMRKLAASNGMRFQQMTDALRHFSTELQDRPKQGTTCETHPTSKKDKGTTAPASLKVSRVFTRHVV